MAAKETNLAKTSARCGIPRFRQMLNE